MPEKPAQAAAAASSAMVSVGNLIQLAKQENWSAVDAAAAATVSATQNAATGDVKARRVANTEGLQALQRGDAPAAVTAFQRGVTADPANVEVRNNYGYALMKAQQTDQAAKVFVDVLGVAPNRTSAWANLAEAAAASNQDVAVAALKLGVHFSASRERTLIALNKVLETSTDQAYKSVVQTVLNSIDQIPPSSSETGAMQRAPSPISTANPQVEGAVRQMLADGRSCYDQRQFSCAITNAQNALRLAPDSAPAMQLKTAAEAAQAQALRNIKIN
jgi:Flp pilus assembly protein TadD